MRRVLAIAAAAGMGVMMTGCKAKPVGRTHTTVAYWVKRNVTVGGKKLKNPVPANEENIEEGKQIFGSYCSICHGMDGQNTGVPFAASISPAVPSLASEDVQKYSDGQLYTVIADGIYPSGMPASKEQFSEDDMWRMVLFIRHLPPAKSLGDPLAYGGTTKP